MAASTAPRNAIRIGVFIPAECQLLDAACVDVLASMSSEYLSMVSDVLPKPVIDLAPSVTVYYIGSVKPGQLISMTANQKIAATNHYSDEEVAPGRLDIVIVPGPDPHTKFEKKPLQWLKAQSEAKGTDILSVCTGILICGEAGILKGKTVCGPRAMQDEIRKRFGNDVVQKGAELRWVQDGNFWSSGGVTNGNDLVAAYARHKSEFFPKPLVEILLPMVDVGDRAQVYGKSLPTFFLGFFFNVFRAWLAGFGQK
ncbi:ThiJ/PfpI family protein [Xylariales sp. AK1849]|nr:ThiJ/PfpI family protein [Xylariales sp. AK1849]